MADIGGKRGWEIYENLSISRMKKSILDEKF